MVMKRRKKKKTDIDIIKGLIGPLIVSSILDIKCPKIKGA